jgi:RNA repair pathway DNA polymerase beta family protein
VRTIVRIKFGSHLYGTATPASDIDFKSVFVPAARDILLQRVRGSISSQRPKAEGEKNVAGEIDEEAYSLQHYLGLAAEGQTVALDVLFAPRWSMVEVPGPEWQEIEANRSRLITRKSAAFVGYCRQQANKYGIKGSRVAAAREALALLGDELEKRGTVAKLGEVEDQITTLTVTHEHMALLDIEGATDVHGTKRTVRHWEVCNRKMPLTQTIKSAHEVMRRIVDEYGHRALQAESNQGVDWKALSHAVRVARQAIELLRTGEVIFPRPEAAHLKAIKLGELPYAQVAEEIDDLLPAVEREAEASMLPPFADQAWIDDFITEIYGLEVKA